MDLIVTLTPNPAIDISTSVNEIVPIRKLRCAEARRDPGGGGINVARVVRRLGGAVSAIYPAGGATGALLRRLIDREDIQSSAIPVVEETREDFTVFEQKSGKQYRFVLPGSPLSEPEWRSCLAALEAMQAVLPFIVCSGSLPPGVPDDFYARVARFAKERGSKVILDTSGKALSHGVREGVYVLKPNLRELQELANEPLADERSWIGAGQRLIESGAAEIIALTLAERGSLLMTREGVMRAHVPNVKVVSTVGAGDSFVGGLVWAIASGLSTVEALKWAVAAGTAAVLNPGTELCKTEDVIRLVQEVDPVCG